MSRLTRLAWTTVAFNVAVIVFGSAVRATESGAGCGPHWPACNGQFIPNAIEGARLVEFTHRVSSAVALALVALLAWQVFRAFPIGDRTRKAVTWAGVFVVVEALIGAVLVLFEWVAKDASVARTIAVPIHLVATLALLASLSLTAYWVGGALPHRWERERGRVLIAGGVGIALIAASGGVTALADTLFPSDSVASSFSASLDAAEYFLSRLRVLHPLIAIAVGLSLIWMVRSMGQGRMSGRIIVGLVLLQFAAGMLNIVFLTPLWLQLVHLALADTLWVTFVLFGADVMSIRPVVRASSARGELPTASLQPPGSR